MALVSQTWEVRVLWSSWSGKPRANRCSPNRRPTGAQPGLRAQWSREKLVKRQSGETKCFHDRLIRCYGEEYANKVKHAQAFGTCK